MDILEFLARIRDIQDVVDDNARELLNELKIDVCREGILFQRGTEEVHIDESQAA